MLKQGDSDATLWLSEAAWAFVIAGLLQPSVSVRPSVHNGLPLGP